MQKNELKNEFLTPREVAEVLRVPRRKVWRLIREGTLPVIVLSPRQRRIPLRALEALAQFSREETSRHDEQTTSG